MKYLTFKQLDEACKKHAYLILRFGSGHQMGVNTKVSKLSKKKYGFKENHISDFVSFRPCSFIEYIQYKHPFKSR
jgi:hypothetical protein